MAIILADSGWNGVCLVGGLFATATLLLSAYEKFNSFK